MPEEPTENQSEKFNIKLERELNPVTSTGESTSYSESYRRFKLEQTPKPLGYYEKLCNLSTRISKIQVSPKYEEEAGIAIRLTHLSITPEGAKSLSYLLALLTLLIFIPAGVILPSIFLLVVGVALIISVLYFVPKIPMYILNSWRAKASDQLLGAVLYMIIYMQHTPNLEQAINFTSRNLPPPLSLDFMKLLWDVETSTYSSISEALGAYLEIWRGKNDDFIEAVHLVESSLYTADPKKSKEILDRSVKTILDGTHDHMLTYAHNLQSPIETLHMLGIVLPVMGLVMLPMITAFMGDSIQWYYLVGLYNIFLPILVFGLGKAILTTRPAGSSEGDVYQFRESRSKQRVHIKNTKLPVSPKTFGILTFLVFGGVPIYYFISMFTTYSGAALKEVMHSVPSLAMSLLLILGLGFGFGFYYYFLANNLIGSKRKTDELEGAFSSAIFELGNRIDEGVPTEIALTEVASIMKKSAVADMFNTISYNMQQRGLGLKEAIFDEKVGVFNKYPSAIVKSVMNVLVESSRKGPKIVSRSLITISGYLGEVRKVNERLKDLLADTIASMQMQAKIFVPLISGIVVGLGVLTMNILLNLGTQLKTLGPSGGDEAIAASILQIFQFDAMLPSFIFQLIIGVYVVEIVFLLSYLLSGIVNGPDEIERSYKIGKNLLLGTTIYLITATITTVAFSSLTKGVTAGLGA